MQAEPAEPYRIRLVVRRAGDAFEASWIEPDSQESEIFPLSLPLDARAKRDLRWYLEDYVGFVGAGDRVLAAELEQKIEAWGRELFGALFEHAEGTRVHLRLMDAARAGRPAILTLGTDEPDVHVQPWEMIRDRRGPLVFQGVTIRRQLRGAGQARRPEIALPLRVLMITSRPKKAGFIDPRNSIAPMLDALDALPQGQVTVDFCEPPTLGRLEEMISEARKRRRPFHIVHFDGHGSFQSKTGIGVLAFERDEEGQDIHLATGRRFGDLLSRLEIPLVILEACRSSDLSDRPIFGSVAPALLQSGVGSVIAFSHSVHIETSKLLIERFYAELAGGLTVGQALEEARTRIHDEPKRWLNLGPDPDTVDLQDWFIPQLYQVGPDPALIKRTSEGTEDTAAPDVRDRTKNLHGFPPEPMYRFHGRAQELLELERAFRRFPAVALTAMGGMGKTALAREAAAWWLRTRRFESAVFHSFEQKAGADRVVQVLGHALEGEDFSSRSAEDQWTSAVELFRQRKTLFVWDNFESTLPAFQKGEAGESPSEFGAEERRRVRKLYRELTEGSPAGRLLVTCRPEETDLAGIQKVPLSGLARPDSLHLLSAVLYRKSIPTDRDGYDRDAIDALLDAVDDHPLSISLVAPHLKTLTPAQIRQELRERLARFADASAAEARNRSLLASLEFSTRRLSEETRAMLPYLGWFDGGVFEDSLVEFAKVDTEVWKAIRHELVATALIRIEDYPWHRASFLRFHPTLALTARASDSANHRTLGKRHTAIYFALSENANRAFHGRQPVTSMKLLALEEANIRSAIENAVRSGARQATAVIAEALGNYLQRAGRSRECADIVTWIRTELPEQPRLDIATCSILRQYAVGLLGKGEYDEAISTTRGIIARLETEGLANRKETELQIGISYRDLGQIYVEDRRPHLALAPSHKAVDLLEGLPGDAAKGNLCAALGDIANAQRALGRLDEALSSAERALAIGRVRIDDHGIAVALGQIAEILGNQQRYAEAELRYNEAFVAARSAGDLKLQGTFLQHRAILLQESGSPERAVELGKKAVALFQRARDAGNEMRSCEVLGSAEMRLGHLGAAEAWYSRTRELAEKLNARNMMAVIAQNSGILHQLRAEQAEDPETRAGHLRRAASSIEASLAIELERENQVGAASSHLQLGTVRRMLGELDSAEDQLQRCLRIREPLNLPGVEKVYANLALVAHDRNDAKATGEWMAKHQAKLAELNRLRRSDPMQARTPARLENTILALARVAHDVRVHGVSMPPDAAEELTRLSSLPAPFGAIGDFLRDVAGGESPPVPPRLPPKVAEILEGLLQAVR